MCFTRIYGFIFCDPKVINSSAIKNITRNGTTFTATRLNNGTFTFTQQDSNTTYANYKGATTAASGTAGLVPAASTANRLKFLRGDGGWQVPTNTTYGAATGSALGLVKTGSNITNSSGTISLTKANVTAALGYTPPVPGNATSTSKTTNVPNNTDTNVITVSLTAGTYIVFTRVNVSGNDSGRRHFKIVRLPTGSSTWYDLGTVDTNPVVGFFTTASITDIITIAETNTFATRVWQNSGSTLTSDAYFTYIKLK